MPRVLPDVELSRMNAGVERLPAEAERHQCVEAFDVIADENEVRRRDAFTTIACQDPYLLPHGRCQVAITTYAQPTAVAQAQNRTPPVATFSGIKYVYVGCVPGIAFDGIDIRHIEWSGPLTERIHLGLEYWNGSAWVEVPFHLDTTRVRDGDYEQSLSKDGRISWHRDQLVGWADVAVGSTTPITGRWVRVYPKTPQASTPHATGLQGTFVLRSPRIRIFETVPVTGLFPVRIKNTPLLIIGSNRRPSKGREKGANLGLWTYRREETLPLRASRYEGAGIYDAVSNPGWQKDGVPFGSPVGSGTAGNLTNGDPDDDLTLFSAFSSQATIEMRVTGHVAGAPANYVTIHADDWPDNIRDLREYEHWLLFVTSNSGGGATVGEWQEVAHVDDANRRIYFHGDFSPVPTAANLVVLYPPGNFVRFLQSVRRLTEYGEYGTPAQDRIDMAHAGVIRSNPAQDSGVFQKHVHFLIEKPLRWLVDAGFRWTSVYHPGGGRCYFVNGDGPMMEYDGRIMRVARADTTSELAQAWSGVLADTLAGEPDTLALPKSKLDTVPPRGRYIVDWNGHLLVAHISGRPQSLRYTVPGAPDIWPLRYSADIRDSKNLPITGARTLYSKLLVWTRESIHEARSIDERGLLSFQPIIQGVGFTAHDAVHVVDLKGRNVLIGPSVHGITMTDGTEPHALLDGWDRVLPGGVSEEQLEYAVGAVLRSQSLYFVAVPSNGSTRNDRLLAVDYRTGAIYPWRLPFGCSALAVTNDASGRETLLLGTDDGHVCVLRNAPTDDGEEIEGIARSAPMQPLRGAEGSYTRLLLTMAGMGGGSINARVFVDEDGRPSQEAELFFDRGDAVFDEDGFQSHASPAQFVDRSLRTAALGIRAGTKGHQVQYEVSGTNRWRLRKAFLEMRALSTRGRQ